MAQVSSEQQHYKRIAESIACTLESLDHKRFNIMSLLSVDHHSPGIAECKCVDMNDNKYQQYYPGKSHTPGAQALPRRPALTAVNFILLRACPALLYPYRDAYPCMN